MIASFGTNATSEAMFISMNGTSLMGGGATTDLTVTNFWDTNWHFIALTYDGTTAKLYVDGVLKASGAESWNLVHTPCNIGAFVNTTDFWNGNLDASITAPCRPQKLPVSLREILKAESSQDAGLGEVVEQRHARLRLNQILRLEGPLELLASHLHQSVVCAARRVAIKAPGDCFLRG
jgi:hypothetical protein